MGALGEESLAPPEGGPRRRVRVPQAKRATGIPQEGTGRAEAGAGVGQRTVCG